MYVFAAYKNEEDPIKNEATRMVTTLSTNFEALKGC